MGLESSSLCATWECFVSDSMQSAFLGYTVGTHRLIHCIRSLVRGDLNRVFNKCSQISLLLCH